MYCSTVSLLRCPACTANLAIVGDVADDEWVESGELSCSDCAARYMISNGIARFVPEHGYADNFGTQWNLFRQTQLDSYTGVPVSHDRFNAFTNWDRLDGVTVLDAGCGAGRFAEIALDKGARVVAVDFSNAVDAAKANLIDRGNIDFVQADINHLPFAPDSFTHVYCLGVIQHTPNPDASFDALDRVVAPGGKLALDVYPATWKNLFFAKYWIRPVTTRLPPKSSLSIVRKMFPLLYAVSNTVRRVPKLGHYLRYLIPVANYTGVYPLTRDQLREWALLDTFDMWAPAYDQPQTLSTVRGWFARHRYRDVEVYPSGFTVGRGVKPTENT